jgi:glycosyltransferase involved in cell wall biosynthesis
MISVVICTYNRAESLRRTLSSVAKMEVPSDLSWEVIVVDNNSTDATRAVVEEFVKASSLPVRYVFEPRQGLSHARNTGVATAKGEIIAFIDDDVFASTDWLGNIWQEFQSDDELGVLGGRVELANPQDLPLMVITDKTRRVIRSYLDASGRIGCCWALRRSVLASVGPFDTLLGAGGRFASAEDIEYVYRICKAGWKILYAPSVLALHNHGRRTPKAERSLLRAYNIGAGAFYAKVAMSGDVLGAKLMYWVLDGRARELLRVENVVRNCRNTAWLIAGFVGYAACRCWQRARQALLPTASRPTYG